MASQKRIIFLVFIATTIVFISLASSVAMAETLNGEAIDGASGTSLEGVTISDGTGNQTVTDENGHYELSVENGSTVTINATASVGSGATLVNTTSVAVTGNGTQNLTLWATFPGDGSTATPYELETIHGLAAIDREPSANYTLVDSIDAADTAAWNDGQGFRPITGPFTGTINGSSHTITNLTIDRTNETGVGLFGVVMNATIQSLRIEGGTITGQGSVGGLIGSAQDTTIEQSVADVYVEGAGANTGGLVGTLRSHVGPAEVLESGSSGTVTGGDHTGGLLGSTSGSATADVDVVRSWATGTVQGSAAVGGLVGHTNETGVEESFATGSVTGTQGSIGGLIGHASLNSMVEKTWSSGSVIGSTNMGGSIGQLEDGTLRNSFSTGLVNNGTPHSRAGGLVGRESGITTIDWSNWDINTSGQNTSDGGFGYSTEAMTGVNAVDNMSIDEGVSGWVASDEYPILGSSVTDLNVTFPLILEPGSTAHGSATVELTSGTSVNVTKAATHVTDNSSVAAVTSDGEITGNTTGTAIISTNFLSATDEAMVTVTTGAHFTIDAMGADIPTVEGETVTVTATLTNRGTISDTQNVTLRDPTATVVDSAPVSLTPGESNDSVVLTWNTSIGDMGIRNVSIHTENESATLEVTITEVNDPIVDRCRTLDLPGEYIITQNISNATTATCVAIQSSHVTLDGQGHTIDGVNGSDGSTGIGVDGPEPLTDVHVGNVTVKSWGSANADSSVGFDDVSNSTVSDVLVTNNTGGVRGVRLFSSDNNTLTNVTVEDSGIGIAVRHSDGNQLDGPTTTENLFSGFRLYHTSDTVITDGYSAGNGMSGLDSIAATGTVVENTTLVANDGAALETESDSTLAGRHVDIGASTIANMTFTFNISDVSIDAVESPPPDPPNRTSIGRFIETQNTSTDSYLDLTMPYSANDLDSIDEESLELSRHNGTSWTTVSDVEVDTENETVAANVTEFGTFGVMGIEVTDYNDIDTCVRINANTRPADGIVNLTSDLSSDETCIEISTSDVTVNGQGHAVSGNQTGSGVFGIVANGDIDNVTVRNLTVKSWASISANEGTGLVLESVDDSRIEDVSILENTRRGVRIGSSSNVTIEDSIVANTSGWGGLGIQLEDSHAVTIANTTLQHNGFDAIRLRNTSGSQITNTDIIGGNNGIRLWWDSPNNTILNTSVAGTSADGIRLADTSGENRLQNVTVADTGWNGIAIYSDGNSVDHATVVDSGMSGVELSGGSHNRISTTTISNASEWSVLAEESGTGPATNNSVRALDVGIPNATISMDVEHTAIRPNVSGGPAAPIHLDESGIVFDVDTTTELGSLNLSVNLSSGAVAGPVSDFAVYQHGGTQWSPVPTSSVNLTDGSLSANFTTAGPVGIFRPDYTDVGSCVTIDGKTRPTNGIVNLTHNISSSETCIEIETSDVIFDGGGHHIFRNASQNGSTGIIASGGISNVTVRNVTVDSGSGSSTGAAGGVVMQAVDSGVLDSVRSIGNTHRGISVTNSSTITIANGTVRDTAGSDGVGLHVENASSAAVKDTTVQNSTQEGIRLSNSPATEIRNVTVLATGGPGIYLGGDSNNSTVVDSSISGSAATGITVAEAADAVLVQNVTIEDTESDGIRLQSNENRLKTVTVLDGEDDGLELGGASGTTITNTTVTNVTQWSVASQELNGSSAGNNSASDLSLGDDTGSLSFEFKEISIRPDVSSAPDRPEELRDVGILFDAENTSASGYLNLTASYTGDAVTELNESNISLWRHNGTDWVEVDNTTTNTAMNTVSANLTTFSPFGVFGVEPVDTTPPPPPPPPPSGGSSTTPMVPPNPPQPYFAVATNAPTEATVGESPSLEVSVENSGNASGQLPYEVVVDGTNVAEETLELTPGESYEESFPIESDEPEAVSWRVTTPNETTDGRIEFEAASSPAEEDEEASDTDEDEGTGAVVGIGLVILLALVAGGYLVYREGYLDSVLEDPPPEGDSETGSPADSDDDSPFDFEG